MTRLKKHLNQQWRNYRIAYLLLVPSFIYFIVFSYYPVFQGFIMSVQDYRFVGESEYVGFEHYKNILTDMYFWRYLKNTFVIGGGNLIIGFVSQVFVAIVLNEVANKYFKKLTQTIIYIPNLFSWVAIGGIWICLLSPATGLVNVMLNKIGIKSIPFMTSLKWIVPVFWGLNTWKSVGYGSIIFLAALTNISPSLYEAAKIDGANRFKQIIHITIPSLYSTMKVVLMLNLINVLRMFSQSITLSNPMVIDKTEVIMTYTYKMGIEDLKMDYASAVAFIILVFTLILSIAYQLVIKKREDER